MTKRIRLIHLSWCPECGLEAGGSTSSSVRAPGAPRDWSGPCRTVASPSWQAWSPISAISSRSWNLCPFWTMVPVSGIPGSRPHRCFHCRRGFCGGWQVGLEQGGIPSWTEAYLKIIIETDHVNSDALRYPALPSTQEKGNVGAFVS